VWRARRLMYSPAQAPPKRSHSMQGDLVERIDGAQARIEFQVIDNCHRIAEPNMFRAQVAMSVDDMTAAHALGNQCGSLNQKPALYAIDFSDQPRRKTKTRIKQNTSIE
jgi:hypothetical protein